MPPKTIPNDGIEWIEIGQAAKHSQTKGTIIGEWIEAGKIPSMTRDGRSFIPMTAANRLKREIAFERSLKRKTKIRTAAGRRRSRAAFDASRKAGRAADVERSKRPRLDSVG